MLPISKFRSEWTRFGALVVLMTAAATAMAQDQPASNMDILRDKLKADKKLLVAENLSLTEGESQKFWPIYEEYQSELDGLNARLGRAIEAYATEYNAMSVTDAKAKALMDEALAIEAAELALKKNCLGRLDGVIPAMKAVRYLQIENKIRALIRFDLAANIPLVK
jgi:Spy/CpxP family protein refolding chaperone